MTYDLKPEQLPRKEAFQLLALDLLRAEVSSKDPASTVSFSKREGKDGGWDGEIRGTWRGVAGPWRVDAKSHGEFSDLKREIKKYLETYRDHPVVFLVRMALSRKQKEELRGLGDGVHVEIVDGEDLCTSIREFKWVARALLGATDLSWQSLASWLSSPAQRETVPPWSYESVAAESAVQLLHAGQRVTVLVGEPGVDVGRIAQTIGRRLHHEPIGAGPVWVADGRPISALPPTPSVLLFPEDVSAKAWHALQPELSARSGDRLVLTLPRADPNRLASLRQAFGSDHIAEVAVKRPHPTALREELSRRMARDELPDRPGAEHFAVNFPIPELIAGVDHRNFDVVQQIRAALDVREIPSMVAGGLALLAPCGWEREIPGVDDASAKRAIDKLVDAGWFEGRDPNRRETTPWRIPLFEGARWRPVGPGVQQLLVWILLQDISPEDVERWCGWLARWMPDGDAPRAEWLAGTSPWTPFRHVVQLLLGARQTHRATVTHDPARILLNGWLWELSAARQRLALGAIPGLAVVSAVWADLAIQTLEEDIGLVPESDSVFLEERSRNLLARQAWWARMGTVWAGLHELEGLPSTTWGRALRVITAAMGSDWEPENERALPMGPPAVGLAQVPLLSNAFLGLLAGASPGVDRVARRWVEQWWSGGFETSEVWGATFELQWKAWPAGHPLVERAMTSVGNVLVVMLNHPDRLVVRSGIQALSHAGSDATEPVAAVVLPLVRERLSTPSESLSPALALVWEESLERVLARNWPYADNLESLRRAFLGWRDDRLVTRALRVMLSRHGGPSRREELLTAHARGGWTQARQELIDLHYVLDPTVPEALANEHAALGPSGAAALAELVEALQESDPTLVRSLNGSLLNFWARQCPTVFESWQGERITPLPAPVQQALQIALGHARSGTGRSLEAIENRPVGDWEVQVHRLLVKPTAVPETLALSLLEGIKALVEARDVAPMIVRMAVHPSLLVHRALWWWWRQIVARQPDRDLRDEDAVLQRLLAGPNIDEMLSDLAFMADPGRERREVEVPVGSTREKWVLDAFERWLEGHMGRYYNQDPALNRWYGRLLETRPQSWLTRVRAMEPTQARQHILGDAQAESLVTALRLARTPGPHRTPDDRMWAGAVQVLVEALSQSAFLTFFQEQSPERQVEWVRARGLRTGEEQAVAQAFSILAADMDQTAGLVDSLSSGTGLTGVRSWTSWGDPMDDRPMRAPPVADPDTIAALEQIAKDVQHPGANGLADLVTALRREDP